MSSAESKDGEWFTVDNDSCKSLSSLETQVETNFQCCALIEGIVDLRIYFKRIKQL